MSAKCRVKHDGPHCNSITANYQTLYLLLVVRDEGQIDHFLFTDDADETVGVEGGAAGPHAMPVNCTIAAGALFASFLVALFAKHLKSKSKII